MRLVRTSAPHLVLSVMGSKSVRDEIWVAELWFIPISLIQRSVTVASYSLQVIAKISSTSELILKHQLCNITIRSSYIENQYFIGSRL